jgi:hypothetical protein
MNVIVRILPPAILLLGLSAAPLAAQVLHVDDRWDECALVLAPSLTQKSWHQFVGEIGHVVYFRPLVSARPMGAGRFEVAILDWGSRIDPADDAWNDTFVHPDSMHWLFEGDALLIPGLMVRAGVSDRVDAGVYVTKSIGANYGFVGGQVQYALLADPHNPLAAAARLGFVRLFGPEDLTASVYGLDFVVSRDLSSVFSPYAVVSGYMARGHERTPKVDLDDENVLGVQGAVGMAAKISVVRLGAEVSLGRVSGYSFKVAVGS